MVWKPFVSKARVPAKPLNHIKPLGAGPEQGKNGAERWSIGVSLDGACRVPVLATSTFGAVITLNGNDYRLVLLDTNA
jgi:hypothetical protein